MSFIQSLPNIEATQLHEKRLCATRSADGAREKRQTRRTNDARASDCEI